VLFSENEKDALMMSYLKLPVFDDVKSGLKALRSDELKLYAFSNCLADDVRHLLNYAGVIDYFDGIVSVEEVKKVSSPIPLYMRIF